MTTTADTHGATELAAHWLAGFEAALAAHDWAGAAALFHVERGVRHDASLNAHATRPIPGLIDATAPRR